MKFISTKNNGQSHSLIEAVTLGLAPNGGLYMPEECIPFDQRFFKEMQRLSFADLAFLISRQLLQESVSERDLEEIISDVIRFPAPIHSIDQKLHILELHHGPSLAFKDFGAQFMARLLSKVYRPKKGKDLVVLVATSGDTGSAVAAGFDGVPGIKVVILFPKGGVSDLQELQLTTHGENIYALEVSGTFDDCQALVKQCFRDERMRQVLELTSANSINIGRLIPQSFYYFEGFKQVGVEGVSFSVPSGNFGNLTAGLMAKALGLPIRSFIAATNVNDIVPSYLETGVFQPRPSIPTISNAMDVGNPSNFDRMLHMFSSSTWNVVQSDVKGYSFTDSQTRDQIKKVYEAYRYLIDPHGAVAILGAQEYAKNNDEHIICLETAHPTKFIDVVQDSIDDPIELHPTLAALLSKSPNKTNISTDYIELKEFLSQIV